jgi:hypothetical protein
VVPTIAEDFVHAEIKSFAYTELDSVMAWAAGFSTQTAASSRSASN